MTLRRRFGSFPSVLTIGLGVILVVVVLGLCTGPSTIAASDVLRDVVSRLPFVDTDTPLTAPQQDIIWEIRFPRVVLALLVGALLSVSGASYQGVFRNPLADPYLLGSAAGAGLGATVAIGLGLSQSGGWLPLLPAAAFVGALLAVMLTYAIGSQNGGRSTASLIVAGVAVTSLLTAIQTFLQQRDDDTLREVYAWLLGRLSGATWADVELIVPYAIVGIAMMLVHSRFLDVMSVGDDEASSLGIDVARTRLVVVIGASIATAAAVAVSGLIGFVGVIVPHLIRLLFGASYRVVLPLSMLFGGGFLVATDLVARTVLAPSEIPIGVVTAALGAPFFLLLLRVRGGLRIS